MFGWPWGGLLYVRDKFPFALGQPEAPNLQNIHPVLERAPGVGIELLTPVSESSGRALHSYSIPKHSRGLINVPYGVAAAVRATPDFEICQHFKSGKTLLEARLTGSFKVKVV